MHLRRLVATTSLLFAVPGVALAQEPAPPAIVAPPPAPVPVVPAPPKAEEADAVRVKPDLEVFAQYAYRHTNDVPTGSHWFHEFDVPRVHAGVTGEQGPAVGRVLIEGVRSTSQGALQGVGGDSLVLRVREAHAGYRESWFSARAGVIPTATIPLLDASGLSRAVAASPVETSGYLSPADVGVMARADLPMKLGWVSLAAYNGEGYTNRELNRGKNQEVAALIRPLATMSIEALGLYGSYVLGSSGTDKSKTNRLTVGAFWTGEHVHAGADLTLASGVLDDSSKSGLVADAFVRVDPWKKLILVGRGSLWKRDSGDSTNKITTLTGAVGYEIATPLETFLAVSRSIAGDAAKTSLAGSDNLELRAVARVHFLSKHPGETQ